MTEPLSAQEVAAGGRHLLELFVADGAVHWLELRPDQDGRSVLVREDGTDRTPAEHSVASRVYEYGGGAAEVSGGVVFFVDREDQRVYRMPEGGAAVALTPRDARRYGDLFADPSRGELLAVCEDHRSGEDLPVVSIVAIPMAGGEPETLVSGRDFYAAPRLSPDGRRLAYVAWDFPNMPWDDTELFAADRDAPATAQLVAGGPGESVCHPLWSPDGELFFVSDRGGWWNIATGSGPVAPMAAEQAQPSALGRAPYDVSAGAVVFAARHEGRSRLQVTDRSSGATRVLELDGLDAARPRFAGDGVVCLAASPERPSAIWSVPFEGPPRELCSSALGDFRRDVLVAPESLTVPTRDGAETYAYFYPAAGTAGPAPLVVMAHGGPVGATSSSLRFGTTAPQFWTSRGYAVVDVNYRGSTGYGRPYREALYHRWGQLEVDDCIDVAEFLVARGDAAAGRVVIRGGSAGGFTTLAALAFRDYFAAGTAYFPVSDLVAFHGTTHKFEARYDEQLIGPWDPELYRARSPIDRVADITAPLLLIQGLEDKVCPPEQSELVVDALRRLGRDVDYVTFADEAHGFVKAESVAASLEAEAAFYARVLGPG